MYLTPVPLESYHPAEGEHELVPGRHIECGPDCAVTGDMCCGGHVVGVCHDCDARRRASAYWLSRLMANVVGQA